MDFATFEIKTRSKRKAVGEWYLYPKGKGKKSTRAKDASGIFNLYEGGAIDLWMSWDGKKKYKLLSDRSKKDTYLKDDMWEGVGKGDKGRLYFNTDLPAIAFNEEYRDSVNPAEFCKNVRKTCELPDSYFSEFEAYAYLSPKNTGFLEGFLLATNSI